MSVLETPMTRRLWQAIGGTLFEEYAAVRPGPSRGARRLDGLVLLDEPFRLAAPGEIPEVLNERVVVIQTKASRLGMNVLGQALFSAAILRKAGLKELRTIAFAPPTTTSCGRWPWTTASK